MQDAYRGHWRDAAPASGGVDLHTFVLREPDGTDVSLRRYQGRWLIVRVGAAVPDGAVVQVSVCGEVRLTSEECARVFLSDVAGQFAEAFSGLPWPSTFVVNPQGGVVAIVSDGSGAHLATMFVGRRRSGAVDSGDIVR